MANRPVLVDSNVLLDVFEEDARWFDWSAAALERLSGEAVLVVNPVVYSEVSVGFETAEQLEAVLDPASFRREPIPYEAAFLAGKCFARYRGAGGVRRSPLPDFFVGSHAAVAGYRLLTRDAARYRSYFPSVELVTPDEL